MVCLFEAMLELSLELSAVTTGFAACASGSPHILFSEYPAKMAK